LQLKIAILGAGMTGAYLYRLLRDGNHAVSVFDQRLRTRCGLTPCAWGTSRGFRELVTDSGLDPARYILRRFDYILMEGIRLQADLLTFDKQKLIRDLLQGATVDYSAPPFGDFDRVIDATGVARALLPPLEGDLILPCLQYRLESEVPFDNRIKLGRIGYAWCFPLSDREYHLGCGSLLSDPRAVLEGLNWIDPRDHPKIRCACEGSIRLTAPFYSQPFVAEVAAGEVWGVGEAIGCVAPLAGDGIVPGMKSVRLLLKWWDDPSGYTRAVLREFDWMKPERAVIDKLRNNRPLGLTDARVLKKNSRRMGMQVGLKAAAALLKCLR
jgi:flavin-dependent dehydrogenase